MRSSVSYAVKTTVLAEASVPCSLCSASTPSTFGMSRSRRITSGCTLSASLTTSSPSPASPTTSKSGWVPRTATRPSRSIGWSSATRSLILSTPELPERDRGLDAGSPFRAAVHPKRAAQHLHPLPHADDPVPALRHLRGVEPAAIVLHHEPDGFRRGDEPYGDAACPGVPGYVAEGLPAHAVDGRLDARRERAAAVHRPEPHGDPRPGLPAFHEGTPRLRPGPRPPAGGARAAGGERAAAVPRPEPHGDSRPGLPAFHEGTQRLRQGAVLQGGGA